MSIAVGSTIAVGTLLTVPFYAFLAVTIGGDTYTYTSGLAKSVVAATGLGVTESENHWAWYKVGSFFKHYHTENRNGAHSFYGIPK